MILNFKDGTTDDIYHGVNSSNARKIPKEIWKTAIRKMDIINAAQELRDLLAPPGNRLEALKGNLKGHHSIRVNDQYRLIFIFTNGNAVDVKLTDYH